MSPRRTRLPIAYRAEGGEFLIELTLNDARQLFNSLDPAPFHERDLDAEAEDYIVAGVREIGIRRPSRLIVHLPKEGLHGESAATIESAIRHYFEYRSQHAGAELRQLLGRGLLSLCIGLIFLVACLWSRQLVGQWSAGSNHEIFKEGLLILGWVAMWRPVEVFLYDWWPILHRIRIFRRISTMPVEVRLT